jgi:MATE family multidrug resistance protein
MTHHTAARTKEFMKQSIPNIGTLLFQSVAGQATTVLVGRLGELSIAASSALSTVAIPWSGTLSATCVTVSGVRVGYHLGRGDGDSAKKTAWLVMHFITIVMVVVAAVFLPLTRDVLSVATDYQSVLKMSATLVPAMLVGTYLNLIVGNITSGVFSGMGRPFIATILSFGLELPMSIGGVAIYILVMHGNLLGVYWWQAISGGLEAVIVVAIMMASNWEKCAAEAQERQEADRAPAPIIGELVAPLTAGETEETSSDDDEGNDEEERVVTASATTSDES